MKGLLHSKRFRKNLKKWLFMYVGTIGLLTCVITYSKYISSFGAQDKARVTKFDVKVTDNMAMVACTDEITKNCCKGSIENEDLICTTENYRPTQSIPYKFSIDYDFEVKTELTLRIYVHKNFDIESLIEEGVESNLTFETEEVGDYKRINIVKELPPKTKNEDKYTITVKYKGYNFNNYKDFKGKLVYIDYYANQIKELEKEGN